MQQAAAIEASVGHRVASPHALQLQTIIGPFGVTTPIPMVAHTPHALQNVFMTKTGQIKLGDFGLSTVLKNSMAQANTLCGTPYYFSPGMS